MDIKTIESEFEVEHKIEDQEILSPQSLWVRYSWDRRQRENDSDTETSKINLCSKII